MKTNETKSVRALNTKETLLHSLYVILIEFRAYSKDLKVKEIADLFHNVPLMLMSDDNGSETMAFLKDRLINKGYSEDIIDKYKNLITD